jgi:hypothetical protein
MIDRPEISNIHKINQTEYEKSSGQYLGSICDESLMCHGLNSNPGNFRWFNIYPTCLCGESCLLVLWCAGGRCGMAGSDDNRGRSRRPGVEDQRW